jgi:hypothetical protein
MGGEYHTLCLQMQHGGGVEHSSTPTSMKQARSLSNDIAALYRFVKASGERFGFS